MKGADLVFWLAITAALGTAVCNGFAVILQKMGADKHVTSGSAHAGVFLKLVQDWPYLIGTGLDLIAWILTLIAVQHLPLFVVQPLTALSVVVTILIERFYFHRRIRRNTLAAIGVTLAGLGILASCATTETAVTVSQTARTAIMLSPLLLLAGGLAFARNTKHYATIILASLAGTAFGATAIVGRMLHFQAPFWHLIYNPLFFALLAYGAVGIWMFVIALQRHHATVVNAAMISFETVVPTIIGIGLLGDRPAGDAWGLVIVGIGLALTGTLMITRKHSPQEHAANTTQQEEPIAT